MSVAYRLSRQVPFDERTSVIGALTNLGVTRKAAADLLFTCSGKEVDDIAQLVANSAYSLQ
jgi:hypothetical protein